MSGGFPGRVVARLMAWQPPVLLDRMFSVVTYGRVIARAFVNSVSPETLSLPGLTRRCFGNYSASSAASVSSSAGIVFSCFSVTITGTIMGYFLTVQERLDLFGI